MKKYSKSLARNEIEHSDSCAEKTGRVFWNNLKTGIGAEDIVIIHSSMVGLKRLSMRADEVLAVLRNTFGGGMTLVFPTFSPENLQELPDRSVRTVSKSNVCWTDILPSVFLHREAVVKSRFPYNTLAAQGPYA
ncbi:MAG: AAC(3) family N-acetyltransferase [Lachnospiraceae bacterium]|nr:AAC(3) family N-acetyltransferase [Lachnospiraceae bacterium]MCM1237863.1 AAC(3) family N-acetyltransferase [Lachnospiraceae bacterium]